MALYAIGDLHLSLSANKPMDIFGAAWENHTEKLLRGWHGTVSPEDTVVVAGDLSWGMSLADCLPDFRFLNDLPGKKLVLKGNHDYYWTTASSMKRFFDENGLDTITILHNNAFAVGDSAVCGTRGWFLDEDSGNAAQNEKIYRREVGRLAASLDAAEKLQTSEKLVFLHYPPVYRDFECHEITELMRLRGVRRCYYGHLHGSGRFGAINGTLQGISYRLISADAVNFTPVRIDP